MLPYTESGSGNRNTVLLFLHFFGSSRREWHHVISGLEETHRCVAADMPGFGEAVNITGYSVTEMAAQVDTLVQSFAPAQVVLIAHSMSGKVSMVVAANPPANLHQLILVAPSPLLPEPMTEDARGTMTIANTTRERAEEFVKGGAHNDLSEEDFASAVTDVQCANPEAWKAWPQSGAREDWSSRVLSLEIPTMLIVGEFDQAIPIDFQRQHTLPLVAATGGRLITLKNAAHLLPYEAASDLVQAMEGLLTNVGRP